MAQTKDEALQSEKVISFKKCALIVGKKVKWNTMDDLYSVKKWQAVFISFR